MQREAAAEVANGLLEDRLQFPVARRLGWMRHDPSGIVHGHEAPRDLGDGPPGAVRVFPDPDRVKRGAVGGAFLARRADHGAVEHIGRDLTPDGAA